MTSSMMTGERRWASARRGGMTVLGKVAVPKPINLPSQKLENHGLDPNVEIVPKGTVSWGSRPSSSSSNPWGCSTLSPKADGSTGSSSHLNDRPSSGGSGTRPSTGSSDRAHESTASAWSSNSRPSSASGILTSNHTSATSLRPRSAETRPGSSQLSRFAEPLSENSGAWGAGTAEKLGVTSFKKDGFSLASGDFPTLGSEKDNVGQNMEPQDLGSHGRPGSSSGGVAPVKERIGTFRAGDVSVNANVKSEATNTWRRDNNPYGEDGIRSSVEKWQADPQGPHPYQNAGIPHQNYEAWHGPPMNNHSGGVWFRGPPGGPPGPPFGSPVPPGGFPMEPFPFYRPQTPANALANPQSAPPPGVGPRAHHPKNGDMYRPLMPDAYLRPGMPMRPGFYPGPVAYESYYRPPMGYHNSNEREVPYMGMAAGPHSYNRYSGQNAHDAGNSHNRSSACGSYGKALASEQVEAGHFVDARGPYRVLLKQQDGWEGKDIEQKWEEPVTAKASNLEKVGTQKLSSWDDDCGDYRKKNEQMGLKQKPFGEEGSYQVSGQEGGSSSIYDKVKSTENVGNAKVVDDLSVKKVEHAATSSPEILAGPEDSSLIKKIDSLNAKARASDGRLDLISVSSKEQKKKITSHVVDGDSDETTTGFVNVRKNHITGTTNPAAYECSSAVGDKSFESTVASGPVISRRPSHGMHVRTDHRGKGRLSSQEADGWRKKSPVAESSTNIFVAQSESTNILRQDNPTTEVPKRSECYPEGSGGGEFVQPMSEPSDSQAQRAKMRELAQQRVKQRQKEEEDRERDQKAKARAKLEELNRRAQAAEGLTQNLEVVPKVSNFNKREEFQLMAEPVKVASESGALDSSLVSNSTVTAQVSEIGTTRAEKSVGSSTEQLLERSKHGHKESVGVHKHNESMPILQDANDAGVVRQSNTPQVYDVSASKPKHLSYKQKQNTPNEKNFPEKFIAKSTEPLKGHTDLTASAPAYQEVVSNQIAPSCESSQPVPVTPNVLTESGIQQRKRNNKGGKEHKVEEASSGTTLPSTLSTETTLLNYPSAESDKKKTYQSDLEPISVQPLKDSKDTSQSSESRISSPSEENHVRPNNLWKSQHSRRMAGSGQTNKSSEKLHTNEAVIWAPVRNQKKADLPDESGHKPVVEASSAKSDNQMQNNSRNKRAEMERYVPKSVAKEMAEQGSVQQPLLADKTVSDEIDEKVDSGSQDVESSQLASGRVMESKNGDHRQKKQGKVHGSWRQRASSESTIVHSLHDAEPLVAIRNVQKSVEDQRNQKPSVSSEKEQPKYSDEWCSSDGWNMPEYPEPIPVTFTVVKDEGVTARGKRHQFKGHRGSGNNRDHNHMKTNSGNSDKLQMHSSTSVSETSQTDLPCASKENYVSGDRSTSHWQLKPQACVTSNQQGSRPKSGPHGGAGVGRYNKKDSTPQGGLPIPPDPVKESSQGVARPHDDYSISMISKVESTSNVGHQEPKRERKLASAKGRPDSSNQGPGNLVENAPPSNIEHMPSGYRRNGNQSNRYNRGHESRGEWSLSGQDNKQRNQPMNRERQIHNAHYEYQPVGPQSNNKANSFEGPKDAPNNGGGKYRERGQSDSRRGAGNHHGRPSGTVRADGYD